MTTTAPRANDNSILNAARIVATNGTYTSGNAATTDIIRVSSR